MKIPKGKWQTDAGNMSNYKEFDDLVYRNSIIDDFLDGNEKYFVIAGKGIGKTLLLSYKRYLLEQEYSNNNGNLSVKIAPQRPYIDYIESIKTTLSNNQLARLQDWEYCKRFWTTIIQLSVISYSDLDTSKVIENLTSRAERHRKLLLSFIEKEHTIEFIFNEILIMGETEAIRFIDEVSNSIGESFKEIHNSIFLFFDRLDQALEASHDSIWSSIQVGLLEAAWGIMRSNRHIKIYLSIRQEAYASHHSRNSEAISAEVATIKYTDKELRELVNRLALFYENADSVEAFTGVTHFRNATIKKNENIFDFMNRYSIGRPRDFVAFCSVLSTASKAKYKTETIKKTALKEIIIKTSSDIIVKNIHDEVRMLLHSLTTIELFNEFVTLFETNIVSYSEMKQICKEYNKANCADNCASCPDECHPFCDLYNMGLLGLIESTEGRKKKIQKFKSPYDDMKEGLRGESEYYFIHPALRHYINDLHFKTPIGISYKLLDDILIGDGLQWNDRMSKLVKISKKISCLNSNSAIKFFKKECHLYETKKNYSFSFERYQEARISVGTQEQKEVEALIEMFGANRKTSVFVCYAYTSEEHQSKVIELTNQLRGMGYDATMDVFLKNQYPNLDLLMSAGLKRDKIVIVLNEEYKRRADNHKGGVWKEFSVIINDFEENDKKYIFASLDPNPEWRNISPDRIGNRWIVDLYKYAMQKHPYNELISYITDESEYPIVEVSNNVRRVVKKNLSLQSDFKERESESTNRLSSEKIKDETIRDKTRLSNEAVSLLKKASLALGGEIMISRSMLSGNKIEIEQKNLFGE